MVKTTCELIVPILESENADSKRLRRLAKPRGYQQRGQTQSRLLLIPNVLSFMPFLGAKSGGNANTEK